MGGGSYGWMAFGTPTQSGAVPTTGSASYTALVRGSSIDSSLAIQGSAALQFNFGAGTLAGHFDPVIYDLLAFGGGGYSLGRYDFTNTIYSTGRTRVSGELSATGVAGTGSFNGQFIGPGAQELMSSWTAPFNNPASGPTSQMFGVLVGNGQ